MDVEKDMFDTELCEVEENEEGGFLEPIHLLSEVKNKQHLFTRKNQHAALRSRAPSKEQK